MGRATLRVDIGAGYNPKPGFIPCDENYVLNGIPDTTYLADQTVSMVHCKNTIHHVKDKEFFFKELKRIMKESGLLLIVECRQEFFQQNNILDYIWYKYINRNNDIYIERRYFDYEKELTKYRFKHIKTVFENEKEMKLFIKEKS